MVTFRTMIFGVAKQNNSDEMHFGCNVRLIVVLPKAPFFQMNIEAI